MRYCAVVDGTSNTWSLANLPSSWVLPRRHPRHRPVTHSRTWPFDGRVEAHVGTRCEHAAPPGMASRVLRARWACIGGPSAAILATPVPPRNRPTDLPQPSGLTSPMLQPFVEYLQGRWQAGCTNVAQ